MQDQPQLKLATDLLKRIAATFLLASVVLGIGAVESRAEVRTDYIFSLSNFFGLVHSNQARIYYDEDRKEMYVTDMGVNGVRIFNNRGMEIYRFGDDWNLGSIIGAVVDKEGNILVLNQTISKNTIYVCNFRGELKSELTLKGLPPGFENFSISAMVSRHEQLYLLDNRDMRLLVTDSNGVTRSAYDLASLTGVKEKDRFQTAIGGYSVDREGNILFTVPVLFSAFKLSPDGNISGFGRPGSAPGRFNNAGGIAADDHGNFFVSDRLKHAILIFDRNFKFVREFGYLGSKPHNLAGPRELLIDDDNQLYVSQFASRGVSVFKITYE